MVASVIDIEQLKDWDSLVSEGQQAAENIDIGRWRLGDLARAVEKQYDKNRIADFAREVNVKVTRVMEYRTVCRFWNEFSARAEFVANPLISYSHMRLAMRLEEMDMAVSFLEECADNAYTIDQAERLLNERLGKPVPPEKLIDTYCLVTGVFASENTAAITFTVEPLTIQSLSETRSKKRKVRLVVYDASEE